MDQRMKYIFAGLFLLVLVITIVFLNPHVLKLEAGDSRRQFNEHPIVPKAFLIKEVEIQSNQADPNSMYRGNAQRTGVYHAALPYHMLRRTWRIDPFNHDYHGASKSTPVNDGKNIYVGEDYGVMRAIDFEGNIQWEYASNADRGIHGTALVVDDTVFWGDYQGVLYAVDKHMGKLQWQLHLGETIGASPLYMDKAIYISVETFYRPNGFVAKVNARNGQVIWLSSYLGAQAHSSPTMSEDKSTIYVGSNNGYLTALNSDTGEVKWRFQTGAAIKGTPAVYGGAVYFCSWDSFMYKISSEGKQIWSSALGSGCQ